MRFQLFSLVFIGVLASSFARPCFPSRNDIKARSNVDHEGVAHFYRDTYDPDKHDINDHDTYPRSTFDPILARSVLQELFPRHKAHKPKPKTVNPLLYGKAPAQKKTEQQAKNRKDAVRKTVAANQQAKAAKRQEYANAKSTPRQPGSQVPKEPKKAPKPNMQKGQAKTSKGAATQNAANERKAQRKQPYRDAGVAYKNTKNLPGRQANPEKGYEGSKWKYNPDPLTGKRRKAKQPEYSSKDVRTAVYNSHLFQNNKVNYKPAEFKNRKEGPIGKKHRPLQYMKGSGTEFPVTHQKGGYQGGDPGRVRAIIQKDHDGGYTFKGVVAHKSQVKPGAPGYNDHHEIHPTKPRGK